MSNRSPRWAIPKALTAVVVVLLVSSLAPRYPNVYNPPRYLAKDATGPERANLAASIYGRLLDDGAREHLASQRANQEPAANRAGAGLNALLAERLGEWSLRWMDAQTDAAGSRDGRFDAAGAHLKRMKALEEGLFLGALAKPALPPEGKPGKEALPRDFVQVARFYRLAAQWQIDQLKAH